MSSFVLVHGAWSRASHWSAVADGLRAHGHVVVAPDLPGHGADTTPRAEVSLSSYASTVLATMASFDGPAVLVGHSMGGTVISTVAEEAPDRIERLIYVAAFMLADGQSLYGFSSSSAGFHDSLLGPALRPGDGVLSVDADQARAVFLGDADLETAALVLADIVPEPLAPLGTPVLVTAERWGRVPRTYLHTLRDRAVPLAAQEEMVRVAGVAATATIDTGHFPMLVRPVELVDALLQLAAAPIGVRPA